jgi:hypothetical protein
LFVDVCTKEHEAEEAIDDQQKIRSNGGLQAGQYQHRLTDNGTMLNLMLPFCLPGSSHLSIETISAPDSGLSRHPAFDP